MIHKIIVYSIYTGDKLKLCPTCARTSIHGAFLKVTVGEPLIFTIRSELRVLTESSVRLNINCDTFIHGSKRILFMREK